MNTNIHLVREQWSRLFWTSASEFKKQICMLLFPCIILIRHPDCIFLVLENCFPFYYGFRCVCNCMCMCVCWKQLFKITHLSSRLQGPTFQAVFYMDSLSYILSLPCFISFTIFEALLLLTFSYRNKYTCTGVPCFIVLHFIMLHRYLHILQIEGL